MPHPFLDRAVIGDPKEVLVLDAKALVVVESLGEFRRNTDHVPIVGQFSRIVGVEPQRPAPQLVDAHRCGHGGEINKDI
jgi:hypothetical protein